MQRRIMRLFYSSNYDAQNRRRLLIRVRRIIRQDERGTHKIDELSKISITSQGTLYGFVAKNYVKNDDKWNGISCS